MAEPVLSVRTSTPQETRRLGECIACQLGPGSVVLLSGDLGSGKTTLAQGICHGLGVEEWANSPTYILIAEYQGRLPVYHCDLYRIDEPDELQTLALDEVFYGDSVALVEWPEVAGEWAPADAIRVRIIPHGPAIREFEIRGLSASIQAPDAPRTA